MAMSITSKSCAGEYGAFLDRKLQNDTGEGFAPLWMPDFLFPFQRHLLEFNLAHGRSATFADCGLGKTPMQLVWAENVVQKTNRPVLILTPLAVAQQTLREAAKFGIDACRSDGAVTPHLKIIITNYEKLHHFEPDDFSGVVCDESSAIKAFDGKRRAQVTEFLRTIPFRLLCTATAAPNDYPELGTSSEALGYLGLMDMLARFFTNDMRSSHNYHGKWRMNEKYRWRFKGHAEAPFWRWVSSWGRACRKPSDLGFPDEGFVLPPLVRREHVVEAQTLAPGMLFPRPAVGLSEEREERRRTIQERCERAAALVAHNSPAVIWCHLNPEGDLLERLISGSRQVKGSTPDGKKEEIYESFASGDLRVLILKPKIGAWGLNWQHCAHVVTFASHSYEQDYQAVRRCWRFGQTREVHVDEVLTEGETAMLANRKRKAAAADRMFTELVAHMNDALRLARGNGFEHQLEVPAWL